MELNRFKNIVIIIHGLSLETIPEINFMEMYKNVNSPLTVVNLSVISVF